ncbi:hypothetical protein OG21DRAFT_1527650 [Imleria badia]|nr:hypothetical protein OG21DRAFT_1527650 [Imleria badia]
MWSSIQEPPRHFLEEKHSWTPIFQTNMEDWQLGSWLLRSGLSMAAIDSFLKLDLVWSTAAQLVQTTDLDASIMSGNRMAHPLLISLANIDTNVQNIVLHSLKVVASVGIMMSDPTGPKAFPISTASYQQFGDDFRHPCHTTAKTLAVICLMCSKTSPDNYINFVKVAKSYGLNGIDIDHDLGWCIIVVGDVKIDYHFTLIHTMVGYHQFSEGVLKLKQVTGRNHCSMQHYIVGIIAGAVPPRFLTTICALMDFRYFAQLPSFDEHALQQLDAALQTFHKYKHSIIAAGTCSDHFNIPKLELLQHVVPSIQDSGAIMQWSANIMEHSHVTEVKNPTWAGNNRDYYSQIARHLDHIDKCFRFDLTTSIASSLGNSRGIGYP